MCWFKQHGDSYDEVEISVGGASRRTRRRTRTDGDGKLLDASDLLGGEPMPCMLDFSSS